MSTIQVDRIIPYQSASVTIEGDIVQANAATTGSNTFVGNQNIQGTLTASIQEGYVLAGGAGDVSKLVATSSFGSVIDTSSFATTGSNTFQGGQIINGGNLDLTGSQYGVINVHTLDTTHPGDIYAGYQLTSQDESIQAGFTFNTYGELGSSLNTALFGGGNNGNGSATILMASPNDGNVHFYKDNNIFHGNIEVTGSVSATTDVTVGGTLNVQSGNINARDIIMDDPGANSSLLMNPNYFSEFKGTAQQWQEGNKKSYITLAEETAEFLLNGWDGAFTYDEALYMTVDGSGVSFKDWDGSYTPQTWLNIPQKLGNPSFKRTVEFEQVVQLAQLDPLPAGGVGQLAVSGSNLYFHNGSTWSQIN